MSVEMPELGTIQERYRILAKLGSGGMADVFLAIQQGAENFKRLVVVKRINSPVLQKNHGMKMFLSEARTVATLNHPHIVKVFDLCRMGKDICIVMEYVDGENLDYLRRAVKKLNTSIPLPIVCKLMIEACNALQHAHCAKTTEGKSLELIHRDVGPHNLMIDGSGYLKVIDFGIAKSATDTDLTSPGMIKGKFSYLAPDLFKHSELDGRVDLFALGLVFYELLTLRRPFSFRANTAIAEVMQRILNDAVPQVSTLVPDLPKELDPILAKSTEKDRDRRYPNCAAMAADIQEFADNFCGIASPQDIQAWLQQHFKDRISRRREFERRALKKASQPEPPSMAEEDGAALTNAATANISDVVPQPSQSAVVYSATGSSVMPAKRINPYAFLILLFVLMSGSTVLVHQLFFKDGTHKSMLDKQVNQNGISENLFIKTEPPNADVLINDTVVGNTGQAGLNLRVEPGQEHDLTIRQKGYDDYLLTVLGETYGQRRIEAKLSPKVEQKEPKAPTAVAQRSTKKRSKRRSRRRVVPAVASRLKQAKQSEQIKQDAEAKPVSQVEEKQESKALQKESLPTETDPKATHAEAGAKKLASLQNPVQAQNQKDQLEKGNKTASQVGQPPKPQEQKVAKFIDTVRPHYQLAKVMRERRIVGEEPEYPRSALRRKQQGEVMVKLTLHPDGTVKEYRFLRDNQTFRSTVLDRIKQWRFSPHYVDGRPVATYSVFKFVFRLK